MQKVIKVIQMSVATLNYIEVIDTKGDLISYENLKESIKNNDIQEPIFADTKKNVIHGNRRVAIAKDLGLKTVPVIVIDKNLSEFEIEKLRIDFLITNRNLSYIDICKIYHYQNTVFIKHNQSYSDYMGEKMQCSTRAIQFKIKAGKMYSLLPLDIQSIFQTIDSTKKVPLKTLKVMSKLEEVDLDNFNKAILEVENIKHENIVSITQEYEENLNRKSRKVIIEEEAKKSQIDKEVILGENKSLIELGSESDSEEEDSNKDEPQNELSSQTNSEEESPNKNEPPIESSSPISPTINDDSHIIKDMKRVFQYEIRKSFNLKIEPTEKKSVKDIQSKLHIDFKEEIELIKSLLGGNL